MRSSVVDWNASAKPGPAGGRDLPVRDLKKFTDFFPLGFTFNTQFTNENAACMVFSDDAYAMPLQEPFFKSFTKRPLADAHKETEDI